MDGDSDLMDSLKSIFSSAFSGLIGPKDKHAPPVVGGMGAGWDLRLLMPQSTVDYESQLRGRLHLNSLIAMGVDYFASNCAASPLIVEAKQGDKWKEIEHDLTQIARCPNPDYTWSVLAHGIAQSWQLDGNVYILDWPSKAGQTLSWHWLPHDRVTPMDDGQSQDGSKLVTHYRYEIPGGGTVDFDPSVIIHLRRGIDPTNMRKGWSPVKSALKEIWGDNVATTYTAALIDNSAVPSLIISPDARAGQPDLSQEHVKGMVDALRRLFTREGAGRAGFLPKGVKVEKLSWSPKELDLGDLSDRQVSRICGAMGFDPMVLGLPSANKTYANREEAEDAAYSRIISPFKDMVAEQLTAKYLIGKLGERNTRVGWDNSKIAALQDDMTEIAARATTMFQGGYITRAEAREMVGLPFGPEDEIYYMEPSVDGEEPEPEKDGKSGNDAGDRAKTVADKLRELAAARQYS